MRDGFLSIKFPLPPSLPQAGEGNHILGIRDSLDQVLLNVMKKELDEPHKTQSGDKKKKMSHIFHPITGFIDFGNQVRSSDVKEVARGEGDQKIGSHLKRERISE